MVPMVEAKAMEVDDDKEDLPTLPISQMWDTRELDAISGDGVLVEDLMSEDQEAWFEDLDVVYLISVDMVDVILVDQLMEEDANERFHFH